MAFESLVTLGFFLVVNKHFSPAVDIDLFETVLLKLIFSRVQLAMVFDLLRYLEDCWIMTYERNMQMIIREVEICGYKYHECKKNERFLNKLF